MEKVQRNINPEKNKIEKQPAADGRDSCGWQSIVHSPVSLKEGVKVKF